MANSTLIQHLNMAGIGGLHPLRGPNDDDIGVRFPAMSDAYDLDFRRQAHRAWKELDFGRKLNEGIYAFAAGPRYASTLIEGALGSCYKRRKCTKANFSCCCKLRNES